MALRTDEFLDLQHRKHSVDVRCPVESEHVCVLPLERAYSAYELSGNLFNAHHFQNMPENKSGTMNFSQPKRALQLFLYKANVNVRCGDSGETVPAHSFKDSVQHFGHGLPFWGSSSLFAVLLLHEEFSKQGQ